MCLVKANTLIVFGTRKTSVGNSFELIELEDKYSSKVRKATKLKDVLEEYLIHSCDFGGGAYFRSTQLREQHFFFNSITN